MKKLLLIITCSMWVVQGYAQDLLVVQGDSLNCKITREDSNYVYFVFKQDNEVRKTLVEKSKIMTIQKNFYAQPELPEQEIKNVLSNEKYHPWLIGISLGGGYRTARAASNVPSNYINKLRLGFVGVADIDYYFNDYFGCGLKASISYVSASFPQYSISSENIRTFFVGPVFACRYLSSTKMNTFFANMALGYTAYRDKASSTETFQTITANTFGMVFDIGYDIGISKNLAIGLQLSSFISSFKNATITTPSGSVDASLPDGSVENISRIDFTIGLKFRH